MNDQPSTPASRARVDEALSRLTWSTERSGTAPRPEDIAMVVSEIARLRRHSEALARVLGDVCITPTDPDDALTAGVFQRILRHMMNEPEQLDRAAEAILREPRPGPGPAVDG